MHLFSRESRGRVEEWHRARERGAVATRGLSTERAWGLTPRPWEHDLSEKQESEPSPAVPPRCPQAIIFNYFNFLIIVTK